jgi:hypothetical protein
MDPRRPPGELLAEDLGIVPNIYRKGVMKQDGLNVSSLIVSSAEGQQFLTN